MTTAILDVEETTTAPAFTLHQNGSGLTANVLTPSAWNATLTLAYDGAWLREFATDVAAESAETAREPALRARSAFDASTAAKESARSAEHLAALEQGIAADELTAATLQADVASAIAAGTDIATPQERLSAIRARLHGRREQLDTVKALADAKRRAADVELRRQESIARGEVAVELDNRRREVLENLAVVAGPWLRDLAVVESVIATLFRRPTMPPAAA
jgi:hypothetical protein